MELLYIYTQKFRNLEQLGFNFSSKKQVTFDTATMEVQIDDNHNHRRHFFGSKITNVTGIVGVNGAGKSNLLELVCYLCKGSSNKLADFLIVFQDSEGGYVFKSNIDSIHFQDKVKRIDTGKSIPYFSTVFFSNISDGRNHRFSKDVIDISQSAPKGNNGKGDAYNQLKFLLSEAYDKSDLERPDELLLSLRTDLSLKRGLNDQISKNSPLFKIIDRYKIGFSKSKPNEQFRYGFRYSLFFYALNFVYQHYPDHSTHYLKRDDQIYVKTVEELTSRFLNNKNDSIQDIHQSVGAFLDRFIFEFSHIGEMQKQDFKRFLDFDEIVENLNLEVFSERISRRNFFKLKFSRSNRRILKDYSLLFDYTEIIEVEWAGISSGHKAFLNLFAQIYSTQRRVSQNEYILICIDEGDLYLHPEWQREFLFRLLSFLPRALDKHFQLILTTHSPFLISDLPKENIILLSKNLIEDKIENTGIEIRQTFGANIHDLYRGPFVLTGSKISEFALRKIKHVIDLLSKSNISIEDMTEINDIVTAVGDEPLFRKLKEMLADAKNKM